MIEILIQTALFLSFQDLSNDTKYMGVWLILSNLSKSLKNFFQAKILILLIIAAAIKRDNTVVTLTHFEGHSTTLCDGHNIGLLVGWSARFSLKLGQLQELSV